MLVISAARRNIADELEFAGELLPIDPGKSHWMYLSEYLRINEKFEYLAAERLLRHAPKASGTSERISGPRRILERCTIFTNHCEMTCGAMR